MDIEFTQGKVFPSAAEQEQAAKVEAAKKLAVEAAKAGQSPAEYAASAQERQVKRAIKAYESAVTTYENAVKQGHVGSHQLYIWALRAKDAVALARGVDPSEIPYRPLPTIRNESEAQRVWGVEPMDLVREAADFYLLLDLMRRPQLTRNVRLNVAWQRSKGYLLSQFRAYVDMAIGGELRHATHAANMTNMPEPIKRALKNAVRGGRSDAWRAWYTLRQRHGLRMLWWCVQAYTQNHWSSAFGGQKWGMGAKVLYMWETGEIDDVLFIDTVWSLQHNGGSFLNKAWDTPGFTEMLDAAFHGDSKTLLRCASDNVVDLFHRYADTWEPQWFGAVPPKDRVRWTAGRDGD